MSISTTAFFGYTVDIDKEIINTRDDYKQALLYDDYKFATVEEELSFKENIKKLNYVSYWEHIDKTDKFIILYDGMSGKYTKLLYIINYTPDVEIYDIESEKFFKGINDYLSKVSIPEETKYNFAKLYKYLFEKELDTSRIHLETIIHYS